MEEPVDEANRMEEVPSERDVGSPGPSEPVSYDGGGMDYEPEMAASESIPQASQLMSQSLGEPVVRPWSAHPKLTLAELTRLRFALVFASFVLVGGQSGCRVDGLSLGAVEGLGCSLAICRTSAPFHWSGSMADSFSTVSQSPAVQVFQDSPRLPSASSVFSRPGALRQSSVRGHSLTS